MDKSKPNAMNFVSGNIYWLKLMGQWFNEYHSGSFKYWKYLVTKQIILFLCFTFPICGEIIYLYYNHDDVSKLAEGLYLLLSEMFTPAKITIFIANRPIIEDILADLRGCWFQSSEPEHDAIMAAGIRKARRVALAYGMLCVSCVTVGCIVPVLDNFETLPTNVHYPYVDETSSPTYQIIYLLQIYYKEVSVIIHATIETLPPVFMAGAVAQLEMLAFNLRNLDLLVERRLRQLKVVASDARALREHLLRATLRRCIEHHYFVIRFVRKIEAAYAVQTGMQFLLSAMVLCLGGLQFFSIENPLDNPFTLLWMMLYCFTMVSEVFMVCHFGDEIIRKSNHLITASYESAWRDLARDLKSSLVIFRERCQKPLSVRAGYMFAISLNTFTGLLRWSYNAFAVMNTMK